MRDSASSGLATFHFHTLHLGSSSGEGYGIITFSPSFRQSTAVIPAKAGIQKISHNQTLASGSIILTEPEPT